MPPAVPPPPSSAPPPPARGGWTALLLAALLGAAGYGVYSGRLAVPERFNPWAPLDVMAPPEADWWSGYKLSRARGDPALCRRALAQTGMRYEPLPDRVTGPGCGFDNAVRLRGAGVRLGAPVPLSCPMALSFFMWERHALQPAALRHFGEPVVALEHLGSYACRNINRGEGVGPAASAARSRHATADALDVAGITLAGGKRISIARDWRPGASALPEREAQFLAEAHGGACRFFQGVLGPDYNAVHRDHFHLETGGYRMCR